jgi:succinate dehydrogenase / fumarate reductase, cytochrome b subunit
MGRIQSFFHSSIGKKVIMAVTGVVLFGFVVGHMIGNLKFYQGPDKINAYAEGLRIMGAPVFGEGDLLWLARLVLLGSVFLHILTAVQLARRNSSARPLKYKATRHVQASYAARTMVWSGPILGLFVIFHILHLTTGAAHPSFDPENVYRNLVTGFQVWYVSVFYIVAMLSLGYHMIHGVWSLFQSLGVNDTPYDRTIRQIAAVATAAVVIGNISFPVSVLLGIVS